MQRVHWQRKAVDIPLIIRGVWDFISVQLEIIVTFDVFVLFVSQIPRNKSHSGESGATLSHIKKP